MWDLETIIRINSGPVDSFHVIINKNEAYPAKKKNKSKKKKSAKKSQRAKEKRRCALLVGKKKVLGRTEDLSMLPRGFQRRRAPQKGSR